MNAPGYVTASVLCTTPLREEACAWMMDLLHILAWASALLVLYYDGQCESLKLWRRAMDTDSRAFHINAPIIKPIGSVGRPDRYIIYLH